MITLFRLGMTFLSSKNKSFSQTISGSPLRITDFILLLGISFTMHCLILELELESRILMASSVDNETSPRLLNLPKIEIEWIVISGS